MKVETLQADAFPFERFDEVTAAILRHRSEQHSSIRQRSQEFRPQRNGGCAQFTEAIEIGKGYIAIAQGWQRIDRWSVKRGGIAPVRLR